MDLEIGSKVDLDDYEPVFEGEDDGLVVKGYEIDGEFIVDFDWSPESKWTFLEDDEKFLEFTVGMIERLCGREMTRIERDQLKFFRELNHSESAEDESAEAEGI